MTKERLVEFLRMFVFDKYRDHLIIMDNARSHSNQYVKDAIIASGNKYLFSVPYSPQTNSTIEQFFNQLKHYLKLNRKVLNYDGLKAEIVKAIRKIKKVNYKNYFDYAYKQDIKYKPRKKSTQYRTPKKYKK